jgi:adenylate cyclase
LLYLPTAAGPDPPLLKEWRLDMARQAGPLTSLFAELRRRRVVRTATVYGVAGWAITEISSTVAPVLLLPEWFARAVVLVVLLGFPVAVGLAWAFDVTPGGIRRTEPGGAARRAGRRGRGAAATEAPTGARAAAGPARYAVMGALAMLVLTAAYLRIGPADGSAEARDAASIRSLAVLPFVDMSEAGDQEFFSDGITEELLNLLAQLPGLQVAARTSSFAFKGHTGNVGEIGRQLNVQAVLEGSVRRDGDRIRVTAQLINAGTGFHLWSANYDRQLTGVLALQDEIAGAIVATLRLRLTGGDNGAAGAAAAPAVRETTIDPEAHAHYLRGLHHWNRRRTEDFHLAIEHFENAVRVDPGFAPAYAGLALAQITLTGYDGSTLAVMLPRARAAALRALELDPAQADAHAALGLVGRRENDWGTAERNLRAALKLNPNHVTAHHWLSQHLLSMGRFDEAQALARRALELDPLSIIINNNLGFIRSLVGDYTGAIQAYEATLELDPAFPTGLNNLWGAYLAAGRDDEALALADRIERVVGSDSPHRRAVPRALRDPAELPAARRAVAELERAPVPSTYLIAQLHVRLGEHDSALDWLERAHAERHYNMPYLATAAVFRPLHGQPRFEALVRALGLEDVQRIPGSLERQAR